MIILHIIEARVIKSLDWNSYKENLGVMNQFCDILTVSSHTIFMPQALLEDFP